MVSQYEVIHEVKWVKLFTAVLVVAVSLLVPTTANAVVITVTATPLVAGCISDFTITYVGDRQLDFSWSYGENATEIMIRGKYGHYPKDIPDEFTEPSDGYLVYSGNLTSCSDTSMDFDQNPGPIYYKAWGLRDDGTWQSPPLEGWKESRALLALAVTILALGITIAAFVIKQQLLHAVGIIGWMIFAYFMYNRDWGPENTYLPTAIAMFGLAMVIVEVVALVSLYLSGRPHTPTYEEEKGANKRMIVGLTRRRERRPWWYR